MKHLKPFGVLVLLLILLLAGCSTDALMERGADMLDRIFAGDSPKTSAAPDPEPSSAPKADPEPAGQDPEFPDAVEPSIPAGTSDPVSQEPSAQEPSSPAPSAPPADIKPSHTDATFFGPGESFRYLPKGIDGIYACTYATGDEAVATVDQDTGKVTAVGPGTTKVTMHVEYNGQYDFECIVRCNWKDKEPSLPAEKNEPSLPTEPQKPADTPSSGTDAITASHHDATFFNPKEHFQLLPVGAGSGYTCTYTTGDAAIASVDEKGVVTAVGPGTTTVTMTLDGGGTEYIFHCIVRCKWTASE